MNWRKAVKESRRIVGFDVNDELALAFYNPRKQCRNNHEI